MPEFAWTIALVFFIIIPICVILYVAISIRRPRWISMRNQLNEKNPGKSGKNKNWF